MAHRPGFVAKRVGGSRRHRRGYTLIEMLTTVAALVIVLGMMVSLARYVRFRSSTELTRDLLAQLDVAMAQYVSDNGGRLPVIAPAFGDGTGTEDQTLGLAANNADFVRILRRRQPTSGGLFANLPVSMYDEVHLRDTWGNLIIYMPHQSPAIGMAPDDRPFFFSAGPDRRFLTRDDNLYSYESIGHRR